MIIHQCFDSKLDDGSKINKLFINAPEFFFFKYSNKYIYANL